MCWTFGETNKLQKFSVRNEEYVRLNLVFCGFNWKPKKSFNSACIIFFHNVIHSLKTNAHKKKNTAIL